MSVLLVCPTHEGLNESEIRIIFLKTLKLHGFRVVGKYWDEDLIPQVSGKVKDTDSIWSIRKTKKPVLTNALKYTRG